MGVRSYFLSTKVLGAPVSCALSAKGPEIRVLPESPGAKKRSRQAVMRLRLGYILKAIQIEANF
jgi:hypothetical protein